MAQWVLSGLLFFAVSASANDQLNCQSLFNKPTPIITSLVQAQISKEETQKWALQLLPIVLQPPHFEALPQFNVNGATIYQLGPDGLYYKAQPQEPTMDTMSLVDLISASPGLNARALMMLNFIPGQPRDQFRHASILALRRYFLFSSDPQEQKQIEVISQMFFVSPDALEIVNKWFDMFEEQTYLDTHARSVLENVLTRIMRMEQFYSAYADGSITQLEAIQAITRMMVWPSPRTRLVVNSPIIPSEMQDEVDDIFGRIGAALTHLSLKGAATFQKSQLVQPTFGFGKSKKGIWE